MRTRLGRWAIRAVAVCAGTLVSLLLVELALRWIAPLQYIVPASDWVPEYGVIAYPDVQIVNAKPGFFRNVYTTNALRLRGKLVPFDVPARKVVLLGDSNVFGFGVDDEETLDARMNARLGGDPLVINLANGGWSLPQEVRRYLDVGVKYEPEAVILHMAGNDLDDATYGINWVASAHETGEIVLRNAPRNPAGRLRRLIPPDGWLYSVVFSSQVMMRLKAVLNRHVMRLHIERDGTTRSLDRAPAEVSVPAGRVIVLRNRPENERRYAALLEAFAVRLREDGVRFIFLTGDPSCVGSEVVCRKVAELADRGLLEHRPISKWFVAGRDFPESAQGHPWSAEAVDALAQNLVDLLGEPNVAARVR